MISKYKLIMCSLVGFLRIFYSTWKRIISIYNILCDSNKITLFYFYRLKSVQKSGFSIQVTLMWHMCQVKSPVHSFVYQCVARVDKLPTRAKISPPTCVDNLFQRNPEIKIWQHNLYSKNKDEIQIDHTPLVFIEILY